MASSSAKRLRGEELILDALNTSASQRLDFDRNRWISETAREDKETGLAEKTEERETVRDNKKLALAERTEERETVREDKRIALAEKTEDRLALEARERSSLAKKKFDMESRESWFRKFAELLKARLNREEAKEELGPIPRS